MIIKLYYIITLSDYVNLIASDTIGGRSARWHNGRGQIAASYTEKFVRNIVSRTLSTFIGEYSVFWRTARALRYLKRLIFICLDRDEIVRASAKGSGYYAFGFIQ